MNQFEKPVEIQIEADVNAVDSIDSGIFDEEVYEENCKSITLENDIVHDVLLYEEKCKIKKIVKNQIKEINDYLEDRFIDESTQREDLQNKVKDTEKIIKKLGKLFFFRFK